MIRLLVGVSFYLAFHIILGVVYGVEWYARLGLMFLVMIGDRQFDVVQERWNQNG